MVEGVDGTWRVGRLVLAGLPIGNLEDAPPRLLRALEEARVIAAEDTRRLRQFASRAGIRLGGEAGARVVSYYDANESRRGEELLADIRRGEEVLVVTDAGMPGVSDPGYRLAAACAAEGVPVTAIPGPSAVTTALVVSGLPTDRFCFEGFPPRKGLKTYLDELAGERRTMVFFESPHRIAATLEAMAASFGAERRAAVCRELTKTYEEVRRGGLGELAEWAADGVRGEISVVVEGARPTAETTSDADLVAAVSALEDEGVRRKEAIARVAKETGVPKRRVYDLAHGVVEAE
ncbi:MULTISPECIES: 16S rRNA (cytidine(1402)-2'-O)-methyltransferase [Nocardiopsis]|uniref:Ribosomal RNA small subunit methyltransferase I n=2 Tax=Nocardiopsis alba TaxID=53437 RepID=A0A7K2IR18_9ACTN|nr:MULTISPECIES: 16S rRNA (cytidine(1402)-2'-O)-methyltransferase [Nocardiopsis]AFR07635.1 tetrapyrrole (Corrin/Porphyrin) Methylases family protein [Nocardiopsis alba ATCC BAA-2165]MEC3892804.1 16S rRNA (cytidine(1402)-2'-O)-methyltransferase [Nocardiopsis sp. LDBS1602]MYR32277.1 16S rRNA (cytidine(1402)-2'-O)-methyltransferase [Nocardiopsis alba]